MINELRLGWVLKIALAEFTTLVEEIHNTPNSLETYIIITVFQFLNVGCFNENSTFYHFETRLLCLTHISYAFYLLVPALINSKTPWSFNWYTMNCKSKHCINKISISEWFISLQITMNAMAKDLDITVTPMPFVQTLKVVLRAPVTMG